MGTGGSKSLRRDTPCLFRTDETVERGIRNLVAISRAVSRHRRSSRISAVRFGHVWLGIRRGRELRSERAAWPPSRNRRHHLKPVRTDTPIAKAWSAHQDLAFM